MHLSRRPCGPEGREFVGMWSGRRLRFFHISIRARPYLPYPTLKSRFCANSSPRFRSVFSVPYKCVRDGE